MSSPSAPRTPGGRPHLVDSRRELEELLGPTRRAGRRIGFVPTMGALHDGHASLIRRARAEVGDGLVVVSIFVNPLQFGAGEDLDRYPRTLPDDVVLSGDAGADLVFAPTVDEVYPGGDPQVTIDPGPSGQLLEGAVRPGHFRGVLTVVAKLFGLVAPDLAVFGEKDYQQLALIRRMTADLCLGVDVVGAETRREDDGLAMSSRNRYLDADQRQTAVALSRALRAAQHAATDGVAAAVAAGAEVLAAEPGVEVDYLVLTDPALGKIADPVTPGTPARVLVAARVGATRLIDNLPVVIGRPDGAVER